MREIKFRMWDKKHKKWADVNQLTDWNTYDIFAVVLKGNHHCPYQVFSVKSDVEYDLLQYTGLKDKNGKEIYDGDIVKSWDEESEDADEYIDEVKLNLISGIWFGKNRYCHLGLPRGFEVIGNIYENPDLLAK